MTSLKSLLTPMASVALSAGMLYSSLCAAADPQSGQYQIEPSHTQVLFTLDHFGFTNFNGLFSGASGILELDAKNPAKSKVDIRVKTETVQTPVDKLNEELKGADWFDVAKYPEAHFVSTKVISQGKGAALVAGDLSLHGVTKPVTLKVKLHGTGVNPLSKAYTVGFDASTQIQRSDFGIKQYVPAVGDKVTLRIEGAFEKK